MITIRQAFTSAFDTTQADSVFLETSGIGTGGLELKKIEVFVVDAWGDFSQASTTSTSSSSSTG